MFEKLGKVIELQEVREFASGFKFQKIVINNDLDYYPVTFKNDDMQKLDGLNPGDTVLIKGFINGRKYTNKTTGEDNYYLEFVGRELSITIQAGNAPEPIPGNDQPNSMPLNIVIESPKTDEDILPF